MSLITTGVLVLVGAAALIAPRMDAERMRAPLSVALEETLGRKVEFREVHYQILPTPGLSAIDLVIPDDPAFGLEPLAYVGEMQAGLSFSSLFSGRLSISSVRLLTASVNLTRREDQAAISHASCSAWPPESPSGIPRRASPSVKAGSISRTARSSRPSTSTQ